MQVVFDNIVFSLQQAGGISVVWSELLKRAAVDGSYSKVFVDYPNRNLHRSQLQLPPKDTLRASMRKPAERYLRPRIKDLEEGQDVVFHSSYFRLFNPRQVANITTVHDLTYTYYRSGLPRAVHLMQERMAVKHSAGVICVSESTRRDLLKQYPWLDERRVCVIHNAADEAFRPLEPHDNAPATRFEAGSYLLYVGNREAGYKNFRQAATAAGLTGRSLVIAGSPVGADEAHMLDQLTAGRWEAHTHVSTEALNRLYNQAFCLLYPSAYEGFGIPVIEAQRASCPVVVQNTSSLPEVAGKGALLCKACEGDALVSELAAAVRALEDSSLRQALTAEGLLNAGRFSWNETYRQTTAFYRRCCTFFYHRTQ